jgi:hypothetical protein
MRRRGAGLVFVALSAATFFLTAPLRAAPQDEVGESLILRSLAQPRGVSKDAPLAADALPPALLAECDARAAAFGAYDAAIAESVAALRAIGVFKREDFAGVRIGFCALKRAGGPVAAASCASDIILLDEKYAAAREALVLNATLAHEMKHVFQHRERREEFGAAYCDSPRYAADKEAMEEEADAFGDAVGELFVVGRAVEIVNRCDVPLAVYLEADDPAKNREAPPAFEIAPARSTALSRERGLSSRFFYYAQTAGKKSPTVNSSSPVRRFIEGRSYPLRETRLAASARATGPFRLVLTCRR